MRLPRTRQQLLASVRLLLTSRPMSVGQHSYEEFDVLAKFHAVAATDALRVQSHRNYTGFMPHVTLYPKDMA